MRSAVMLSLALLSAGLTGCDLPGRPKEAVEVPRPEQIVSFEKLYGANCAGCHGADGQNGAASNLRNPEYQAWIDDATLRGIIVNGEKGVLMPGFGKQAGASSLTDQQIDILVHGMRTRWGKPDAFGGATPPPYRQALAGDPAKGQAVYVAACASCHGASAEHPGPSGSVLDGSYLALINERTIRTTIVPGRPDIGQPDWRHMIPGRALTDAEVTDVGAWMISQTPHRPGRPYPNQRPDAERPGEVPPLASVKQ